MTIPPSAPPVLAEEPAELAETILHYIGGKTSDVLAATNAVLSLVAQARQGREDAERLREHHTVIDDALDKAICQLRGERKTAEFWHGSEHTTAARTTLAVIDGHLGLLDAAREALRSFAATPSPSPEGGNAL